MKKLCNLALAALFVLTLVAGVWNVTHTPATVVSLGDGPPCPPALCPPPPQK